MCSHWYDASTVLGHRARTPSVNAAIKKYSVYQVPSFMTKNLIDGSSRFCCRVVQQALDNNTTKYHL